MFTIGMSWRTKVLLFYIYEEGLNWKIIKEGNVSYLTKIKIRWFGLFVCLFFLAVFVWVFVLFCFVPLFACIVLIFFCLLSFRVVSVLIFDLVFCFCCFTSLFFSFSFFFFVCRKENNSMFRESLLVLKTHCIKTYTLLPCFALCLILLR